jgi:hypothetical protein
MAQKRMLLRPMPPLERHLPRLLSSDIIEQLKGVDLNQVLWERPEGASARAGSPVKVQPPRFQDSNLGRDDTPWPHPKDAVLSANAGLDFRWVDDLVAHDDSVA